MLKTKSQQDCEDLISDLKKNLTPGSMPDHNHQFKMRLPALKKVNPKC